MTAWTLLMPETTCACLIVLMMPRWLHEVRMTRPLPLTKKLVPISCSKSSGMKVPVFFAGDILSGKHPKPLTMPTFSLVGCSGFSELMRDFAGGETMIGDDGGPLRHHQR